MAATLSFGYAGDGGLGDRLLGAVLRGEKTATSSLAVEYLSGQHLPRVGQRLMLVDSGGQARGVVETTRVTIAPLSAVGDDVARDEGEGFADAEAWRRDHIAFWHDVIELVRADAADSSWQLRDEEPVVVHWFRLVSQPVTPGSPTSAPPARSTTGLRDASSVVTVRGAEERDGPALARIDLATWTSAVSPAPPPAEASSYVFFTDRTSPDAVLVAEVDGVVVGWVKVQPVTAMASHAHVLEIGGLAVDPAHQGTGVGRHLVEAAAQECIRRGARKLTLRVLGPNLVARRLYERCGFVVEGVLKEEFRLGDRYVDDVLMALPLPLADP